MPEVFAKPYDSTTIITSHNEGGVASNKDKPMTADSKSHVETPFSQFKAITGQDYSSKYFETTADVSKIEEYVVSMINNRGLKDSTASYEQIMQELFDKIGVEANQESLVKYNKVLKYISMIGKVKTKEERKTDLIKRVKEAEKAKFEKRDKAVEQGLEKAKEKIEQLKQDKVETQARFKELERQNQQSLNTINKQKEKMEELLGKEKEIKSTSKEHAAKLNSRISKMEQQLNEVKEREKSLIYKNNKIKSLII